MTHQLSPLFALIYRRWSDNRKKARVPNTDDLWAFVRGISARERGKKYYAITKITDELKQIEIFCF